jgi:hypothetical protein
MLLEPICARNRLRRLPRWLGRFSKNGLVEGESPARQGPALTCHDAQPNMRRFQNYPVTIPAMGFAPRDYPEQVR